MKVNDCYVTAIWLIHLIAVCLTFKYSDEEYESYSSPGFDSCSSKWHVAQGGGNGKTGPHRQSYRLLLEKVTSATRVPSSSAGESCTQFCTSKQLPFQGLP
jgi:hypothetical protein